jgi:hypothetical protein
MYAHGHLYALHASNPNSLLPAREARVISGSSMQYQKNEAW